jgi:hypothetical protein
MGFVLAPRLAHLSSAMLSPLTYLLGRPRAGLYGALLYGATSVAIMFCTTLLKEVWVTAFMTWWVVGALAIIRSERKLHWLAFGIYCGLGIALRSTLLLMALLPWSLRNHHAYGGISPLPHNSGVVLHQPYNDKKSRLGDLDTRFRELPRTR